MGTKMTPEEVDREVQKAFVGARCFGETPRLEE